MTHLEQELHNIKQDTLEMIELVQSQIKQVRTSLISYDKVVFEDVKRIEKRLDAFELKLSMDCENALALFSPVAIDLRFILSVYKMVTAIERLGDYAFSIINIIEKKSNVYSAELLEKTQCLEMVNKAEKMIDIIYNSFEREDSMYARQTFLLDDEMDSINDVSEKVIKEWITNNPDKVYEALYLLEIIQKLERFGDHVKNMTHEIIFYLEAKMIKHQKKLMKKEKEVLRKKGEF